MEYESPVGGADLSSYLDPNPALGTEGSRVRGAAIENAMRELHYLIQQSGQTPSRLDLTQVYQAVQLLIANQTRPLLLADRAYYVAPSGNDANNGLALGTPFATPQRALDVLAGLDLGRRNVTIRLADGTYTSPISCSKPWVGEGIVSIVGNAVSPQNVVLSVSGSPAILLENSVQLSLFAFELRASGLNGTAVIARNYAKALIGLGMRFGTCSESHIQADGLGSVVLAHPYSIVGDARIHVGALDHGRVSGQVVATLVGTRAFSVAFAFASEVSNLRLDSSAGAAFVGTATGRRYEVHSNAVIYTNGGGSTFFPGNSSGLPFTGGVYIP